MIFLINYCSGYQVLIVFRTCRYITNLLSMVLALSKSLQMSYLSGQLDKVHSVLQGFMSLGKPKDIL